MLGKFAGFEHERVAGGEGRRDLPRCLQQRVVPRCDQTADADGFVHDTADDVGVAGVDEASRILPGELAEGGEAVRDVVHVDFTLDQALAGVESLGTGERRPPCSKLRGYPQQKITAFRGRNPGPYAGIERGAGRADRRVDIRCGGLTDRAGQALIGRAANLPGAGITRRYPHATNEQRRRRCHFEASRPRTVTSSGW